MTEKSMRVYMMEYHGKLYTAYLPSRVEGRYVFEDYNGYEPYFSVCVVAQNGVWTIHCGADADFVEDARKIGKQAPIETGAFVSLLRNGITYNFYADEDDGAYSHYLIKRDCRIRIGRTAPCDMIYDRGCVSREHAILDYIDGDWTIADTSRNGTYLNGGYVSKAALRIGDVVFICGLFVIIGAGYLAVNNEDGRVVIRHQDICPYDTHGETNYIEPSADEYGSISFDRQPRRKFQLEPEPITVDAPPLRMNGDKTPFLLRMANPALMGGRAIAGGNLVMALSSMVIPFFTQGFTEKDKKGYEEKRAAKYREYISEKRQEILSERNEESDVLNERYPQIREVVSFPEKNERLWERRNVDDDFLNIRIGTGRIPLIAELKYPIENLDMEPDPLLDEVHSLQEEDFSLPSAPVMLSLKESYVVGLQAKQSASLWQFVRNMILQIVFTHSYDEVKIVLIGDVGGIEEDQWDFHLLRYLPHCWDDNRNIRFIATDKSSAFAIGEYLKKDVDEARAAKTNLKTSYVVFALNRQLFNCVETFNEILSTEEYIGISIVTAFDVALKETQKLIEIRRTDRGLEANLQNLFADKDTDQFLMAEAPDSRDVEEGLRQLIRVKLKSEGSDYELPVSYSFMEMFNAGKVEYLNPLSKWESNDPTASIAAPVGIGTDGEPFYLDLHQKKQGPHGLIAGTTGSGKSEFIITYVLSLAVNYSPDEVAFVLIDYKGGGLVSAFEDPQRGLHLPHVVGTITNLDGAAIQRSLVSISSEMKRRQGMFNEAKSKNNTGTMDIYEYQKLRRKNKDSVPGPIPHLFLIADEFAEMKSQQPEFMDALISTARIGRSLGVHLILATQKPSGVVNDQIWSNTRFRICLKVATKQDSNEMLKRPEAADIRETGRFYLQVGYNEYFGLGQSAYSGAKYIPREVVASQKDETVEFIDTAGVVVYKAKPPKKDAAKAPAVNPPPDQTAEASKKAEIKQLVAVVQYLSDLAKAEHIEVRRLWLDPLPEKLDDAALRARYAARLPGADAPITERLIALIGEIDDPENQVKFPYFLDMLSFHTMLLVGNAGSGKSTYLRALIHSLAESCSPEEMQLYILDLSHGMLSVYKDIPHCGAYLTEQDDAGLNRLMTMLKAIIEERRALFAQADVSSFEAYIAIKKLPLILFVMDSYTNIATLKDGYNFHTTLHEFLRLAAPYGIRVILSVNHINEVYSKSRNEADCTVALEAKDKYDYLDILGARVNALPPVLPGRGLCVQEGRVMQYHVAMRYAQESEQDRTQRIRSGLFALSARYADLPPARRLPMIDAEETYEHFCQCFAKGRIPLGYTLSDIRPIALPFRQLKNLSLYFGDKPCIKPVLRNLSYACRMSNMKMTVICSSTGTRFDEKYAQSIGLDYELVNCDIDGLVALIDNIVNTLQPQIALRNEYCEANGLRENDKTRTLKAAEYIAARTVPHLYLFEDMSGVYDSGISADVVETYQSIFCLPGGYSMYFVGAFYDDTGERAKTGNLHRDFTRDQLALLFGGRFDKQPIYKGTDGYQSVTKPLSDQAEFILRYGNESYQLRMPLGIIEEEAVNPDDKPII